ncbi:Dehydrogenase [Planctomycetes bacterium Pan216]|uniref:Dehydrogenase n=1 Tax=Kolteria novifilia TaxID=2527975 RepID=A0A518B450_9BACT|nr:Dehydrogenase [Planctomycetes bacterium Pan216]
MSRLRTAVVGVGHMGRHHARILGEMPEADLVAVVDHDLARAKEIAERAGTQAVDDASKILKHVDAVVVAVPTSFHHAAASPFLNAGIATLVEKPLATSLHESAELVKLAEASGAVLQVGHSERYNPAWIAAEEDGFEPNFLSAQRFSRYPFRSIDVSVVLDVMIHDIDLTLSVLGSEIERVEAVGGCVVSPSADWADVSLLFTNGRRAQLSASRVDTGSSRTMRMSNESGWYEVDFVARSTKHVRYDGNESLTSDICASMGPEQREAWWNGSVKTTSRQHDTAAEPLRLELRDFLSRVENGGVPKVSGQAGYAALALALQIDDQISEAGKSRVRRAA